MASDRDVDALTERVTLALRLHFRDESLVSLRQAAVIAIAAMQTADQGAPRPSQRGAQARAEQADRLSAGDDEWERLARVLHSRCRPGGQVCAIHYIDADAVIADLDERRPGWRDAPPAADPDDPFDVILTTEPGTPERDAELAKIAARQAAAAPGVIVAPTCSTCCGTGLVDAEPSWSDLPVQDIQACPRCDGTGIAPAPGGTPGRHPQQGET